MSIKSIRLDQQGWAEAEALLNSAQRIQQLTQNLIQHLRDLNAQFVLLESEYVDRDFSEAYSSFYSRLFRRHTKLCSRLLFFSEDLTNVLVKSESCCKFHLARLRTA